MGWAIVAIVRHPIDLLVASGTRLTHDPASMLADLEWFRGMAVLVKDYYECLLGQGDHVGTVRHEDLLGAPARTICRLGQTVGVEVSAEEATAIWDAATLEGAAVDQDQQAAQVAPPCPGAWRRLLDQRHVRILRDLGYGPLLGALGYATALDVDAARPTPLLALAPSERRDAAYRDFEYHALYGKPVDLQHEGLRYWRDPTLGLSMLTTDPDLCQLATMGLASRYFRLRLLASSAHGLATGPRP
jgi:hypothetical protein